MLALLLVAASLGMSNFAAAVGIGVAGVDNRTRLRVGLVFGAFESAMPLLGLVLGKQVSTSLGHAARWVAAGLLIAVGLYALVTALRGARDQPAPIGTTRLVVSGLALSLDNLVVGFALGAYSTSIVTSAIVIGVVSAGLAIIGLEIGARLGKRAGERGELLAGVMLIFVGVAIAAGLLS